MIWMVTLALVAAVAAVATFAPLATARRALRMGVRADGTPSPRRHKRERAHARRALARGVVLPLAAVAALGTGMVLVDALVPWSSLAVVFGRNTPETTVMSEALVEAFRQGERDAALVAEWTGEPAARPRGVVPFLMDHWPVNLAFALVLLASLWKVYRRAVRERLAYQAGVRARRREYAQRDVRSQDHAAAEPPR
jgi:hypothetical protein